MLSAQYSANAENCLLPFQQPYNDDLGPNLELKILGTVEYTTFDPKTWRLFTCHKSKVPYCSDRFWEPATSFTNTTDYYSILAPDVELSFLSLVKVSSPKMEEPGDFLESSCVGRSRELNYQNLKGFIEPISSVMANLPTSSVVDLQPLFFLFTLATITALVQCIIGQSVEIFENEEHNTFANSFNYTSRVIALHIRSYRLLLGL